MADITSPPAYWAQQMTGIKVTQPEPGKRVVTGITSAGTMVTFTSYDSSYPDKSYTSEMKLTFTNGGTVNLTVENNLGESPRGSIEFSGNPLHNDRDFQLPALTSLNSAIGATLSAGRVSGGDFDRLVGQAMSTVVTPVARNYVTNRYFDARDKTTTSVRGVDAEGRSIRVYQTTTDNGQVADRGIELMLNSGGELPSADMILKVKPVGNGNISVSLGDGYKDPVKIIHDPMLADMIASGIMTEVGPGADNLVSPESLKQLSYRAINAYSESNEPASSRPAPKGRGGRGGIQ